MRKKNEEECRKCHWIMLIDEVQIWRNQINFSSLKVHFTDISIFMAINPTIINSTKYDFVQPDHESTLCETLTFKHRSSTEISMFLLHFTRYHNSTTSCSVESDSYNFKSIDSQNDVPISMSTFPSGGLPMLVKTADNIDDKTVLRAIYQDLIMQNEDVLLIYHENLESHEFIPQICDEISKQKWKTSTCDAVMGIEAGVVILYHCSLYYNYLELVSRAKYQLIMVERYFIYNNNHLILFDIEPKTYFMYILIGLSMRKATWNIVEGFLNIVIEY